MKKLFFFLLLFPVFYFPVIIAQTDIEDSKNHPLISRYPGSIIAYYDEQDFNTYSIATGPVSRI